VRYKDFKETVLGWTERLIEHALRIACRRGKICAAKRLKAGRFGYMVWPASAGTDVVRMVIGRIECTSATQREAVAA